MAMDARSDPATGPLDAALRSTNAQYDVCERELMLVVQGRATVSVTVTRFCRFPATSWRFAAITTISRFWPNGTAATTATRRALVPSCTLFEVLSASLLSTAHGLCAFSGSDSSDGSRIDRVLL